MVQYDLSLKSHLRSHYENVNLEKRDWPDREESLAVAGLGGTSFEARYAC